MEIYLDESGNLGGLGARVTEDDPYFVLVALVVREDHPIKRCIRDLRRKLKKRYKVKSELKFSDSDDASKRRILECIGKTNNDIAYILLHKSLGDALSPYLEKEPQILYNELCKLLLRRVIDEYGVPGPVSIVMDKFLYGAKRKSFDKYLADNLGNIQVSHVDSKRCPCIQAADFVAGAIGRKYRETDDLFYKKIQHKIMLELDFIEPDQNR